MLSVCSDMQSEVWINSVGKYCRLSYAGLLWHATQLQVDFPVWKKTGS